MWPLSHPKSLVLVYVEQTIVEQKKIDFKGEIKAIYTGLLIYSTLLKKNNYVKNVIPYIAGFITNRRL